ncbi:hypothetical protein AVEN_229515-1 [Araneus ventricosus]|uniref:Uncharacterized protein n=1 Tax=Araneus ventricosus TaxID=182803 RepID=A0A4Y2EHP6_ARAVE|nr:hypothetical protein AVEN_229515-1 [Araneus ventricosus]
MNYHLVPSVQHMAGVMIALAMYYDKDIENVLEAEIKLPFRHRYLERDRLELWKLIEMKTVEKLSFLPNLLNVRLSKCIRPIHEETCQWIRDHKSLLKLSSTKCYLTCKSILCWKANGTIDRIKTAKKLVQDTNIDVKTRFAIACTYFLEGEVLSLWYGDNEVNVLSISRNGTNAAVRFWVKHLKKGYWRKHSLKAMINGYFKIPRIQRSGIPLRISSFFPYLSYETKKRYFSRVDYITGVHQDDFRLCMQIMDERERVELFCKYPAYSLCCFLEWPLQSLFMEMAHRLWSHMNKYQFHAVLDYIVMNYILKGLDDFDYVELLKEFWRLIPAFLKDEIKKMKKYFVPIDVALNYDKEKTSLSLPETLEKYVW